MKTVLTGDGGDELFGGYDKYLNFVKGADKSILSFFETNSVFSQKQKQALYTKKMYDTIGSQNCLDYVDSILQDINISDDDPSVDRLNVLLYLETKLLLEGNNLVKPDRMGMGNSLEARMPLMDYRVVEYMSSLPSQYKVRDGITKYLFKKIAATKLPEDIVYRKKQMFTVPIGEWFKEGLRDTAYQILLAGRTIDRGLFRLEEVKRMLDDHVSGRGNYTRQLRLLIIIELWHRIFIDDMSFEAKGMEELMK